MFYFDDKYHQIAQIDAIGGLSSAYYDGQRAWLSSPTLR